MVVVGYSGSGPKKKKNPTLFFFKHPLENGLHGPATLARSPPTSGRVAYVDHQRIASAIISCACACECMRVRRRWRFY